MKFLIVLSGLVALAVGDGTYTSENDNLDIDAVVNSPEKLQSWVSCFIDRSPCDTVQSSFKVDLPEAIQESCAKCTSAQKVILKKFLAGLKEKSPADYELYRKKYDPENKYFEPLVKAIA